MTQWLQKNVFFTDAVIIAANCDGFVRKDLGLGICSDRQDRRTQKRPEGLDLTVGS